MWIALAAAGLAAATVAAGMRVAEDRRRAEEWASHTDTLD